LMPSHGQTDAALKPASPPPMTPYRLTQIKHSSDIILVFDGAQFINAAGFPTGNAAWQGQALDNFQILSFGLSGLVNPALNNTPMTTPLNAGPNQDAPGFTQGQYNIRWRHGKNAFANFLFCDMHVGSLRYIGKTLSSPTVPISDLTRANVYVNLK
jgi:prepilin-type processing-associated H-X9-DG protein